MKKITLVILLLSLSAFALFAERCDNIEGKQSRKGMQQEKQGNSMQGNMRGEHKMMQNHGEDQFQCIMNEMELTDAQQAQVTQLQDTQRKWDIQHRADVETLQIDKRAALRDNDFTKAKKITKQIFEKKSTAAIKRLDQQETLWNILTKEQQEKATTMRQQRPRRKMRSQQEFPQKQGE